MSLTYSSLQTQILDLVPSMTAAQYNTTSPGMIDYSEQRCYRELDLLSTRVSDSTGTLTASNPNFTAPQFFVVIENVNVVTPATGTVLTGSRNPLTRTDKSFIYSAWPSATGATVPKWWAALTDQAVLVAPWPDQAYPIEVVGTIRPPPLSATNTSTYLTTHLPDLFVAGCMVYISGWMRNFGSQGDDPRMAVSWEGQFQTLLRSANIEELRKRYAAFDWTSQAPSPIATKE